MLARRKTSIQLEFLCALNTPSIIARIRASRISVAQSLMKDVVALWQSRGLRVAGTIEELHGLNRNAVLVRDIMTGSTYPNYFENTTACKGHHFNPVAATRVCASLFAQLSACDVLVLSKFDKLESSGLGLFPVFEAAAQKGKPTLTMVPVKHLSAWQTFAPNATVVGSILGANLADVQSWWDAIRYLGEERQGPDEVDR